MAAGDTASPHVSSIYNRFYTLSSPFGPPEIPATPDFKSIIDVAYNFTVVTRV